MEIEKPFDHSVIGKHACFIYEDELEHRTFVPGFLGEGIQNGEKILYFFHEHSPQALIEILEQAGFNGETLQTDGRVEFQKASESLMTGNKVDIQKFFTFIKQKVQQASNEKFASLRVLIEMGWAKAIEERPEELFHLESQLNDFFQSHAINGLCQYPGHKFSALTLLVIAAIHPQLVIENRQISNPLFFSSNVADTNHKKTDQNTKNFLSNMNFMNEIQQYRRENDIRVQQDQTSLKRNVIEIFENCGHKDNEQQRLKEIYHLIIESLTECVFVLDFDWRFGLINETLVRTLGISREKIIGTCIIDLFPGIEDSPFLRTFRQVMTTRKMDVVDGNFQFPDGHAEWIELQVIPVLQGILCIARNNSSQKIAQDELNAERELLQICHFCNTIDELLSRLIEFLRKYIGCEVVSVRLHRDVDFSCHQNCESPAEFIEAVKSVCEKDTNSEILYDSDSNPLLEKLYCHSLCGDGDLAKPYFTANGSFWTNNITALLDENETDGQVGILNRSKDEKYESVAFIPIRSHGITYGLLQLLDTHPGKFTARQIEHLEHLMSYVSSELVNIKTNQELKESEDRYHRLIDASPTAVIVMQGGKYIYGNPAGLKILGYDNLEEFKGVDVLNSIDSDSRELVLQRSQNIEQGSANHPVELKIIQKNGQLLFTESVSTPITYNGKPAALIISKDISTQKLAQQVQKEQEEILKAIRQAQASYIAGENTQKTFNNILQTIIELTGSQYGFLDSVHLDDEGKKYKRSLAISNISWDEKSRQLYQQLIANNLEFRNINNLASAPILTGQMIISNAPAKDPQSGGLPKGHPVISSFMGIPMFFGGRMVGVLGMANRPQGYDETIADRLAPLIASCAGIIDAIQKDETRQKDQISLKESEELFRHSFDHSPVGTALLNPNFQFVRCNQALCDFLGYKADELIGKTFLDVTHEDDKQIGIPQLRAMLAGSLESTSFQKRYIRKDGGTVWGEISITLTRDNGGAPQYFLPIIKDITDRKIMEEKINASLEEKKVLLREIHHRVKNNLAAILGLIEMERHNSTSSDYISLSKELANRILSMAIIHEQLYISESLSRINFQDYLETFIAHLNSTYHPSYPVKILINAKGIELDLDLAVPCALIINEMVTNSLKYAFPQGKPGVFGEQDCVISVSFKMIDSVNEITCTDNGVGIPNDLNWREAKSMGLRLIRMLGEHQLGGTLELDRSHGTSFKLVFKNKNR